MDIWDACREAVIPRSLKGELIRVVESQEQIASRSLVDDLAEQALIELLLEHSKPPVPLDCVHLHYLLSSPFRYPPLEYGSRFGARHEPSLFYGALSETTALTETAYYRLVFWQGMEISPPGGSLTTEHTLFAAGYASDKCVCLQETPFDQFESRLTSPHSYHETQRLGSRLRGAGIELLTYVSARDPDRGLNIALFSARPFSQRAPLWKESWLCDTRAEEVVFYNKTAGTCVFKHSQFLVLGEFPYPPD
jgi:hypothetical protein